MKSVPAAVSYREDIVETLKERFFTRLDRSLEEGREPEISEAALAEIRAQYQTTFSNFLSTAFDVVFRNELASKLPGTVTGKLLRIPISDSILSQDLGYGCPQGLAMGKLAAPPPPPRFNFSPCFVCFSNPTSPPRSPIASVPCVPSYTLSYRAIKGVTRGMSFKHTSPAPSQWLV